MRKTSKSIDNAILSRIYGSKGGMVFSPSHFLDLGSRRAVDLALHRLVKRKILRRLARGLYEYPREHPELGTLAPDIDKVARALAKSLSRVGPAQVADLAAQASKRDVSQALRGGFLKFRPPL